MLTFFFALAIIDCTLKQIDDTLSEGVQSMVYYYSYIICITKTIISILTIIQS